MGWSIMRRSVWPLIAGIAAAIVCVLLPPQIAFQPYLSVGLGLVTAGTFSCSCLAACRARGAALRGRDPSLGYDPLVCFEPARTAHAISSRTAHTIPSRIEQAPTDEYTT